MDNAHPSDFWRQQVSGQAFRRSTGKFGIGISESKQRNSRRIGKFSCVPFPSVQTG